MPEKKADILDMFKDYHKTKKASDSKSAVLLALQRAYPLGVQHDDLIGIAGLRFQARIVELRREGWNIHMTGLSNQGLYRLLDLDKGPPAEGRMAGFRVHVDSSGEPEITPMQPRKQDSETWISDERIADLADVIRRAIASYLAE